MASLDGTELEVVDDSNDVGIAVQKIRHIFKVFVGNTNEWLFSEDIPAGDRAFNLEGQRGNCPDLGEKLMVGAP